MEWKDLQIEFDALRDELRFYRIDYQWGAAGIYYRLAGRGANHATRRFEVLANIAGQKLSELPQEVLNTQINDAADPISKWYEALRHHSGSFSVGFVAHQSGDNGENAGNIFTGSLAPPADSSALLCLQFSSIPTTPKLEVTTNNKLLSRISTLIKSLNSALKREAEHRGYLWLLVGFIITVLLAVLAI